MEMRLVIEHMRQAGLDADAEAVIQFVNESKKNWQEVVERLEVLSRAVDKLETALRDALKRR